MEMDEVDTHQQEEIINLQKRDVAHDTVLEILKTDLVFVKNFILGVVFLQIILIFGSLGILIYASTLLK